MDRAVIIAAGVLPLLFYAHPGWRSFKKMRGNLRALTSGDRREKAVLSPEC
jgi:hypothetical protein